MPRIPIFLKQAISPLPAHNIALVKQSRKPLNFPQPGLSD